METNFLNFMFFNFAFLTFIIGFLLIITEPYLPEFLSQSFRYGKHSYKGQQNNFVKKFELPKSYFKHFYAFALFWSYWGFYLILKGIIISSPVPTGIMDFLDLIASSKRKVQIDSTSALIAIVLMTMQCTRRFYESWKLQIFSSNSKINLSHYLIGYFHYFGAICAILANTEGFVRGTYPTNFGLKKLTIFKYLCIALFHFAWKGQYTSNMILINGRKNKNGTISEKHVLPRDGAFNLISSPHMFFEIVMYCAIWGILSNSSTWFYCTTWVIINQVQNGWFTHKWYIDNFPNYPQKRRAIIPFIL